jgi:hypothetical protein
MQSCCAHRIVILLAGLALAAGCTPVSRESSQAATSPVGQPSAAAAGSAAPAKTDASKPQAIEPAKTAASPSAESSLSPAETRLALTFTPGHVTTYRLTTGSQRQVTVRGAPRGEPSEMTGGATGSGTEVTWTQRVQQVDPNGCATLDIRIEGLKVLTQQIGDPIVDFNSARPEDASKPLAKLIGRGYQVQVGPDGRVNMISNVDNARRTVQADETTPEGQTLATLLSDVSIRDRHTVEALPTSPGVHKSGQSWSQIQTVSFSTLGSKAFEKIYTFKGLEKSGDRSVAVIGLEGVLSSKGMDQAFAQDDKAKALAATLPMSFDYRGQCRLDLTDGQVEASGETLDVQWLALDPKAKTGASEGEPNSFLLRSMHVRHLQRVTLSPAATPAVSAAAGQGTEGQDKVRLALQFKEGESLEYAFSTRRTTQIQWDPNRAAVRPDPNNTSETTEILDLVMSYTPTRVEPNGLTTLTAECKSVKARRTQLGGTLDARPDAVEGLRGKTFTLTVDRSGRIHDASSLDSLLKEIGKLAFREDPKQGRIKDPEMIGDVVATQWFLWDAVASADANGLSQGKTWESRLSLPTPMVMRKARDVTYTLEGVQKAADGCVATITSKARLSDKPAPTSWPIPYSGRFRPSGPFGFLGGYQILSFEGKGSEQFDVDAGISKGYEQQFRLEMQAAVPMGLNARPKVIIRQTIRMEETKK